MVRVLACAPNGQGLIPGQEQVPGFAGSNPALMGAFLGQPMDVSSLPLPLSSILHSSLGKG